MRVFVPGEPPVIYDIVIHVPNQVVDRGGRSILPVRAAGATAAMTSRHRAESSAAFLSISFSWLLDLLRVSSRRPCPTVFHGLPRKWRAGPASCSTKQRRALRRAQQRIMHGLINGQNPWNRTAVTVTDPCDSSRNTVHQEETYPVSALEEMLLSSVFTIRGKRFKLQEQREVNRHKLTAKIQSILNLISSFSDVFYK